MRLQLTKRTDYAIRACLYLASNGRAGPASSRRIAEHMDIPERFLPRVLADLSEAGIVEAKIGRSGGYRLQRSPDRLSILELIETVEGASRSSTCVLRQRACDASRPCAFHPVWEEAQTAFIDVLATTTLTDLAAADRFAGAVSRPSATSLERNPG
jgi:Rrf2 family protein